MDSNIKADYIIIGGGIFGCSTAYNLANQGAKNIIVIVEKWRKLDDNVILRFEKELFFTK